MHWRSPTQVPKTLGRSSFRQRTETRGLTHNGPRFLLAFLYEENGMVDEAARVYGELADRMQPQDWVQGHLVMVSINSSSSMTRILARFAPLMAPIQLIQIGLDSSPAPWTSSRDSAGESVETPADFSGSSVLQRTHRRAPP